MARKILVAVDEGEESAYALSWCLKNLMVTHPNSKDTLVLLYAKPPQAVYIPMDSTELNSTLSRYALNDGNGTGEMLYSGAYGWLIPRPMSKSTCEE
ncbi:hypothetical protein Sango_0954300 [Sesamum angolense]|uniref:UspA domain-containing protein n=1 Tax=Sesamum angolense TaxID=2727404 RepID=A0AAE1WZ59_9LAMI|nr:hypothetical protein Sango_0954300 [Sesamum angolense]